MSQGERDHDEVETGVGERQLLDVALVEADVGHLVPGDAEHLGRLVDPGHGAAEVAQVRRVAPRATRRVERPRAGLREAIEQRSHDEFLGLDQWVRTVVHLGPFRVAGEQRPFLGIEAE